MDDHRKHMAVHIAYSRSAMESEKTYGPVRWRGRVLWRNYRRPIKNGRAFLDLYGEQIQRHLNEHREYLSRELFRSREEEIPARVMENDDGRRTATGPREAARDA